MTGGRKGSPVVIILTGPVQRGKSGLLRGRGWKMAGIIAEGPWENGTAGKLLRRIRRTYGMA